MKKLCVEIVMTGESVTASQVEEALHHLYREEGTYYVVRELGEFMEEPEYSARSLIIGALSERLRARALTQRHVDQCTAILIALSSYAKDNTEHLIELAELSAEGADIIRKGLLPP